jgi:hypothetical protein
LSLLKRPAGFAEERGLVSSLLNLSALFLYGLGAPVLSDFLGKDPLRFESPELSPRREENGLGLFEPSSPDLSRGNDLPGLLRPDDASPPDRDRPLPKDFPEEDEVPFLLEGPDVLRLGIGLF